MTKTVEVTDINFSQEVLSSKIPVLVDFWAPWCGPCKMIAPVLEDVAESLGAKVKIAKLNVDRSPEKASEYGVRSIPTLMLFKGGKAIDSKMGYTPKESIIHWIENAK